MATITLKAYKAQYEEMVEWAKENCPTFVWALREIVPVAVPLECDFEFENNDDAVMFSLRWS